MELPVQEQPSKYSSPLVFHEKYVRLCVSLCPCGWLNDPQKPVRVRLLSLPNIKSGSRVRCWIIDMHIEVPRVDYDKLSGDRMGETSAAIRARVQAAGDIQNKRFWKNNSTDIVCNAGMRVEEIRQFCKLQDEGQSLMPAAMTQLNWSAHAYIVETKFFPNKYCSIHFLYVQLERLSIDSIA